MNNKKRVLVVMVLAIIMIFIVSVSAGFWDLFKFGEEKEGLEGELEEARPAKAYANVTSPPNPPVIPYVNKPYDPLVAGLVSLNPSPSSTNVRFSFIALEDYGSIGPGGGCGSSNLPGSNPGDVIAVPTSIRGNFSAISNEEMRAIINCEYRGAVSSFGWGTDSCDAKNYSCNVTAQYYDRGAKGGFNWTISVQIYQSSNTMWSVPNNTQTFQYANRYAISIVPSSINWTKNPLVLGTLNVISDNNITLTNNGNVNLLASDNDLTINATRLNHTLPVTPDFITSRNFTADDDLTPCDQGGFTDEVWTTLQIDVNKFTVGSSISKNVTFCVPNVPTNIPAGIYESMRDWVIRTTNG